MESQNTRKDPIADLLTRQTPSARFEVDSRGYTQVIFEPDELERFNRYIADELADGIEHSRDRWQRAEENIRVYRGLDESGKRKKNRVPLATRIVNQITAWIVQSILSRHPVFSAVPEDFGEVDVVMMAPEMGAVQTKASVEDIAEAMEAFVEHLVEKQLPFRKVLSDFVLDICMGADYPLLKVGYSPDVQEVSMPMMQPLGIDTTNMVGRPSMAVKLFNGEKERKKMLRGSPFTIDVVSTLNFVTPADCDDVQTSPWIAERLPRLSAMQIREKFSSGEYTMGKGVDYQPTEEELKSIIHGKPIDPDQDPKYKTDPESGERKYPRDYQEAYEMWVFWPISLGPGEDGRNQIIIANMCVPYHMGAQHVLAVYENPFDTGRRPFFPGFYRQLPHELKGESPMTDIAPLEDVISSLYRLQIQNQVQSTVRIWAARSGSTAWKDLMKKRGDGGVKPGDVVAFTSPEEIKELNNPGGGANLYQEMNLAFEQADMAVGVSGLDFGHLPGRTADAAIARVHEQSKMMASMALEAVRESLSHAMQMLIEVIQQYQPVGFRVPIKNPKIAAMIGDVIGMPRDPISNVMKVRITASSQDQSREVERERLLIDYQMITQSNQQILQSAAQILSPEVPPVYEELLKFVTVREEEALRRILALHRRDADISTLQAEEIDQLRAMKHAAIQQMQMGGQEPQGGGDVQQQQQAPDGGGQAEMQPS